MQVQPYVGSLRMVVLRLSTIEISLIHLSQFVLLTTCFFF